MKLTPSQYVIRTLSSYDMNDPRYSEYLCLYLDGLSTNALDQFIIKQDNLINTSSNTEQYLKIFKRNNINFDPVRINDDPTRRYFETHLCYQTLLHYLPYLSLSDLNNLYAAALAFGGSAINELHKKTLSQGEYQHIASEGILGRGQGGELPNGFLSKCKVLCKLGAYATDLAKHTVDVLPHDIYSTNNLYQEHYRARNLRPDRKVVINKNLGIMRAEMLVPKNDVATSLRPQMYKRPTDNSDPRIVKENNWPNKVFNLNVLPYANSPSGTMLCQLRLIIALMRKGTLTNLDYNNYLRCFIAAMLYGSGGHTLYEFVVPITLDELKNELPYSIRVNSVSDLFYVNNEKACMTAMENTISYNKYYCKLIGINMNTLIQKSRLTINKRNQLKAYEAELKNKKLLQEKENKVLTFDLVKGIAKLENKRITPAVKKKLEVLREIQQSGFIDWPNGNPGEKNLLYKKRLITFYCDLTKGTSNPTISEALNECIVTA